MPAEITIREDGFAEAAFAREPAWHGLGRVYDKPMTSAEALIGAGLNWRVIQKPMSVQKADGTWMETDWRANVREDNDLILGVVSRHYKVVQNVEAFEFLDALVEGHEMRYESAFSLYGGRKVVLLAQMPGVQTVVEGDHLLPYVLLSLSHDGSEAIRFGPTAVRVVCANTYVLALRGEEIRELSIRHSGDIKTKLNQARNILGIASDRFAQYAEIGQKLAQCQFSQQQWIEYLDLLCPRLDPRDPDYTELRAKRIEETREAIALAYNNARQATAPRTAWAAYNAVAEHIDHLPRRGATHRAKAEARFNVCLYGVGRDMKRRAFQAACKFAGLEMAV